MKAILTLALALVFLTSAVGGDNGLVLCVSHLGNVAVEVPHDGDTHCHDSDAEIEHHAVMECLPDDHGCSDFYLVVNVVASDAKRPSLASHAAVAVTGVLPLPHRHIPAFSKPLARPIYQSHDRLRTFVLLI